MDAGSLYQRGQEQRFLVVEAKGQGRLEVVMKCVARATSAALFVDQYRFVSSTFVSNAFYVTVIATLFHSLSFCPNQAGQI